MPSHPKAIRTQALHEVHNRLVAALEEIDRRYHEVSNSGNVEESLRVNAEFHHAIYAEARMPILQQIIESLWARTSPYLHIYFRALDTDSSDSIFRNVLCLCTLPENKNNN